MAQTLQTLSIISFAIAGVCLVLTVFFWFFFKIPNVIGDLSGKTARKSIAKMRAANEKIGNNPYKEGKINVEHNKVADGILNASLKNEQAVDDQKPETGLLTENKAENFQSETTGLLIDENATAPLGVQGNKNPVRTGGKKIEMIEEVIFIHTDEKIG